MENIKFDVGSQVDTAGTSKRGSIVTTYNKIVSVFGTPSERMSDNIYNAWYIEFTAENDAYYAEEGDVKYVIASLYDWGAPSDPAENPDEEYRFNIGGKEIDATFLVYDLLG